MKSNIIFLESGSGWGGSSSFLYNLLKYFDRQKFSPLIVLYNYADGPYINRIRNLGIEIIFLSGMPKHNVEIARFSPQANRILNKIINYFVFFINFLNKDVYSIFRLLNIIKRRNIKAVVVNNDIDRHIAGVLASTLARIPCICRKAGIGGRCKIKKMLSKYVDVFIAISDAALRDHLCNKFPYKKILTIYEGIDINEYRPLNNGLKIREMLGITQNLKIIGTVSRIDSGKGHRELIKAASDVLKEYPGAVFLIVGEDLSPKKSLRKYLEGQVASVGLRDKIVFAGWKNNIPDILSAIDIYVQPSDYPEGLCIASIEAQACGKPSIVTDAGGLTETVVDGVTGFIVPKKDSAKLSATILKLLNNEEMAARMGVNARAFAEKTFDITKNINKLERVVCEAIYDREGNRNDLNAVLLAQ